MPNTGARASQDAASRAGAALAALAQTDLVAASAGLRPLRAGWGSTELWRVTDRHGRELVLRIFPGPTFAATARTAAGREAAAHSAARAVGVPTPEVMAVLDVAVPDEPSAAVMVTDFAPGVTLAAHLVDHPEDGYELGRRCGAALARLSRARVPAVVAARSWRDWPAADPLGDAVRARLPTGVDEGLLHLDLHPENVLVVTTGGVSSLSVVLDWTNARSGPMAADLARSLAIVDLVGERPDLLDAGAVLPAYASGLVAGSGGTPPAPEYRWWALACQVEDLAEVAARPDGWLRPADVARWRRRLRRAMGLPAETSERGAVEDRGGDQLGSRPSR